MTPEEPKPMSRATAVAYALALPLSLLALVFWPAGSLTWTPGWVFAAVLAAAFGASAAYLAKVNPVIYRARARFQDGTKGWDLVLLAIMLPAMMAVIPLAAYDAARAHWSNAPLWVVLLGYAAIIAGIAGTAWAQAVNPFFEPGVRLQTERGQHVIDTGPYRLVRHPGYSSALLLFIGLALALGSWWALIPAGLASAILVLRTALEDSLLRRSLDDYEAFTRRTRARLIPGVW
jgi:protein-S-isoprenylcysteine O-methyltransferase Ste14